MVHADEVGCTILSTKGKEKEWSRPETYSEILDGEVSIAVTEDGLADSVQSVDGSKVFLKPLNEEMGITTFLTKLGKLTYPFGIRLDELMII